MKYIIFIIVLYASFFSTLSDDRKWYYIDSVEIDGKMDKINSSIIVVDSLNNKYFFEHEYDLFTILTKRLIKFDNEKWFNLNINEYDLNIHYTFQLHSPQVDIDNSLCG